MELINQKASPPAAALEIPSDPSFTSYQIEFLSREIEHLVKHQQKPHFGARLARQLLKPRQIIFLRLHLFQFYWTVTRLLGLVHTDDGGIRKKPSRPILAVDRVKLAPGPRVLIDVTATYRNGGTTGIGRVVREVAHASIAGASAIPVVIENGQLLSYYRHRDLSDVVKIFAGDRLLLLDVSWAYPSEYLPILQKVEQRGGSNIWCLHDLIPILYPGLFGSTANETFRRWFEISLPHYDAVVTVSKSVAEDFRKYVLSGKLPRKPSLRLGWFRLGADFAAESQDSPSPEVLNLSRAAPFFLTVGTLEPRKNHTTALAALELLWNAGVDVSYIIVGKCGRFANALRARLEDHPEFERRLFWFKNCDDPDLRCLYRHAVAVIQPSVAEGFGLPIIEAAHLGTPVIASDIRVFHEVGGSSIAYFDPLDPGALADRAKEALDRPRVAPNIAPLSWTEATKLLLRLITEESYEYSFSNHR